MRAMPLGGETKAQSHQPVEGASCPGSRGSSRDVFRAAPFLSAYWGLLSPSSLCSQADESDESWGIGDFPDNFWEVIPWGRRTLSFWLQEAVERGGSGPCRRLVVTRDTEASCSSRVSLASAVTGRCDTPVNADHGWVPGIM